MAGFAYGRIVPGHAKALARVAGQILRPRGRYAVLLLGSVLTELPFGLGEDTMITRHLITTLLGPWKP